MLYIREEKEGTVLKVRVQPRAAKNETAGLYEDALKLRLTAPPVDGEANEACRRFLAELFSVPRSRVEIVAGHTGRNKMIRISGLKMDSILQRLGL